ncbi:MAG: hypothetical protein SOY76_02310 [Veillonella caviae]|nr:hypothetical protein [Veillonella caviae]
MKLNTLKDMIDDYKRYTQEIVSLDGFYFDDEDGSFHDNNYNYFKFFDKKGFLFWCVKEIEGEKYICLLQTYGIFKHMADYVKEVMRLNDIKYVLTFTTRNPKAHMRKWHMKRLPVADYSYRGETYYALVATYDDVH